MAWSHIHVFVCRINSKTILFSETMYFFHQKFGANTFEHRQKDTKWDCVLVIHTKLSKANIKAIWACILLSNTCVPSCFIYWKNVESIQYKQVLYHLQDKYNNQYQIMLYLRTHISSFAFHQKVLSFRGHREKLVFFCLFQLFLFLYFFFVSLMHNTSQHWLYLNSKVLAQALSKSIKWI